MLKIYQLTSEKENFNYIGKTVETLNQRLSNHKSDYKQWQRGTRHWNSSYLISKHDDVKIELIEEVNNSLWEHFWIQNSDCCNKYSNQELFIHKAKCNHCKLGFTYLFEISVNKKRLIRKYSTDLEFLKSYRDKWLLDNYDFFRVSPNNSN